MTLKKRKLNLSQHKQPSNVPPTNLTYFSFSYEYFSVSGMNTNVQEDMSRQERKRQQVIQELISTEESYNTDMQIALEVNNVPCLVIYIYYLYL